MEPCVLVAQFGMARHYQNDFLMVRSVESWFISQLFVVTEMSRKCLHLKGAIGGLKSNTRKHWTCDNMVHKHAFCMEIKQLYYNGETMRSPLR